VQQAAGIAALWVFFLRYAGGFTAPGAVLGKIFEGASKYMMQPLPYKKV
jgi:hypothetical protein